MFVAAVATIHRYGPVFKTSLVGHPLIVSLDPEFNQFIFQQQGKLFRIWYPNAGSDIIGKKSIITFTGAVHKFIRSFSSKLFGLENLKEALIQELEDTMKQGFAAWAAKPSIEVNNAIADVSAMGVGAFHWPGIIEGFYNSR